MKRQQEKIKDLVEPQAFDEVQSYASEPARALAAYRFTDATSDLLGRWLDALADLPKTRGAARSLAGLRGVGKSHTLAAFAALCSLPDLRNSIPDAHVATSARRLLNRAYVVAHVERGTRGSLQDEIASALASALGGTEAEWINEPAMMLNQAAQMADGPLVMIIDTTWGRETRVRRNDGSVLSQIASVAEQASVFIALALDDDIEGADGANVSLSGSYQIDYLDPEHLYHIADTHLFHKTQQSRAALHDIYTSLRTAIPSFNWSEPRFTAVYPVHPLVAEVAPAVRLYAPTFAFLPFAAMAGARATNRPARSLIVLDEVFDRAEYDLRKSDALKEAFAAYDSLSAQSIAQLPIMERLPAKLALKGLFILSLDGRGATARELSAGMLLHTESDHKEAVTRIERVLDQIFAGAPVGTYSRGKDSTGDVRYRFEISAAADFDTALHQSAEQITLDGSVLYDLLFAAARARFADWPLVDDEGRTVDAATFSLMWRGTARTGRFIWGDGARADNETAQDGNERSERDDSEMARNSSSQGEGALDWEVLMPAPEWKSVKQNAGASSRSVIEGTDSLTRAIWRPAKIRAEEAENLRRLIALRTDANLLANFGETARAAERTHASLAERLWSRLYLDEGVFVTKDATRQLTHEARSASTLSSLLALMEAPLLDATYPEHPHFTEPLREGDAAHLVGDFFSGANQGDAEAQKLARLFAAPLGLAAMRGNSYIPEAGDQSLQVGWVREVLALTESAQGETVPLETVYARLKERPFGLQREAQYLILAALVAQRRVELVTSTGDRITRRTLDRALRWDQVAGLARPATSLLSDEGLTVWARLLTGHIQLQLTAEDGARETVRAELSNWLSGWRDENLLEKFSALPDGGLTTRTWSLAAVVRKSFSVVADALEAERAGTISLEEALQRVADAFGDSEEQFARATEQLAQLRSYTEELDARERALDYIAFAETTSVDEIERARREILSIAEDVHSFLDQEAVNRFTLLWQAFHERYIEHYTTHHDEAVGPMVKRADVDELLRGEDFREFEALSQLSLLNQQYWDEALALIERARSSQCKLPVREILDTEPSCPCGFRLAHAGEFSRVREELEELCARGHASYRRALSYLSRNLAISLDAIARNETDETAKQNARKLSVAFAGSNVPEHFTLEDVRLIERAVARMTAPPLVRVRVPAGDYGMLTREELRARLDQWTEELPDEPALIEVVAEDEKSGT
ncbi:MAG TPA: hypothetical protein VK619_16535 [Pyrinomonadaceae bacterium]|nr:hypothetical protein [Pyrinomonadaceae bacterium]